MRKCKKGGKWKSTQKVWYHIWTAPYSNYLSMLAYKCFLCFNLRYPTIYNHIKNQISICTTDCYNDTSYTYTGNISVTESGKTCQVWGLNSPHDQGGVGVKAEEFPDKTLPSNYCRYPSTSSIATRPWCYTTDPNTPWEHCDVKPCTGRTFID